MTKFAWHARYHQAALDGMLSLSLEERGAYNTVLDLIYSRQGPIPDDDRWLAGWMQCSARKWRSLRDTLVAKGKLHVVEGQDGPMLSNDRAETELENSAERSRNAAENGAKGGRKRAERSANQQRTGDETDPKANENNGDDQAGLKLRQGQDRDSSTPQEPKGSRGGARRKPETTIPAGFPDLVAIEVGRAVAEANKVALAVELQAQRFRAHAEQTDRRCRDWSGAWRNWLLKSVEDHRAKPPPARKVGFV